MGVRPGPHPELNKRQEIFVKEYVTNGFNATQAALSAGYTKRTASVATRDMLKHPTIKKAITEMMEEGSMDLDIRHKDLLKKLKFWYESDITQTIGLTPKQMKELPPMIRNLISSYRHTKRKLKDGTIQEVTELSFVSKEKAIEMVAKHIGFYEKDNAQKQLAFDMDKLSDKAFKELMLAAHAS